jgi:pimeloyl-ACP methyl ester carboxylesterase
MRTPPILANAPRTAAGLTSVPAPIRAVRAINRSIGHVAPALAAGLNQRLFVRPRRIAPRDWELAFERTARRERIGRGLSVLRLGEGPVVACMHGWEGRATQFGALAPALAAQGYAVVAIDGPGHGQSPGRVADPILFARALRQVAEATGPFHAVVGHSMGGGAAIIAVAEGLPVTRLVSIAAPASLLEVLHRFADAMHLPPRATRHFVAAVRRHTRAPARLAELTRLGRAISGRSLIIHARDDREVPFSDAERLAAAWPTATLVAVDGLGHRRILRDDAVIARVAAFVAGGDAGPDAAVSPGGDEAA